MAADLEPVRIAMWSGPRNISTAMMRSFGARPDAVVIDEPFYAAYLAATGLIHPMREQVLAVPASGLARSRRSARRAGANWETHLVSETHDPSHARGLRARLDGEGAQRVPDS